MTSGHDLTRLTTRFTDAFNRDDLDAVMAFFADHAVYDQFDGQQARGRDAIRAAFEPQFRGDFGKIRFHDEDIFADAAAGKVLTRWRCTFEGDDTSGAWRGLDILHFEDGLLVYKGTYAKAKALQLEAA